MTKMPCHISDGPTEDDRLNWDYEITTGRRLVLDLNIMIAHIGDKNSFDKSDLIRLLKRARNYIHNTEETEND